MNWKYYNPKFEYEEVSKDTGWPWAGHKRFAYDFVRNVYPNTIVELGTHKGTSLWSFCQAIKDGKLDAEIFAIDTWLGEEHAGFFGEEVFDKVKEIRKIYYNELKIYFLRKTFNEAVTDFADKSIDLLHIDGLHTYNAVKNDFENWNPKVKDDGVIIFHDIFVNRNNFGVYKLLGRVENKYQTLEFYQSYGLGVLFKNANNYKNIFKSAKELQIRYSYEAQSKKDLEIK